MRLKRAQAKVLYSFLKKVHCCAHLRQRNVPERVSEYNSNNFHRIEACFVYRQSIKCDWKVYWQDLCTIIIVLKHIVLVHFGLNTFQKTSAVNSKCFASVFGCFRRATQALTALQHDAGTSDDSGRASERLTTSSVAPRDADSSRDRLSDVRLLSHCACLIYTAFVLI